MRPTSRTLRLADLLAPLSVVADLGFGLAPETSMRACLIATALARRMMLGDDEVRDCFFVPLLMHVGCVAQAHEAAAALGDERNFGPAATRTNLADPEDLIRTFIPELTRGVAEPARQRIVEFVYEHIEDFGRRYDTGACEVARTTAARIGLPESTQRALYEVHEFFGGGWVPRGLKGDEISLPARVARVAADAAFLCGVVDPEAVTGMLRQRAGGVLDPAVVAVFESVAPEVLAEATTGDPSERILEVEPAPFVQRDRSGFVDVASAFGDLGDLKAPFLHGHSRLVTALAMAAAERLGLEPEEAIALEVAALLHDLGRVGISNSVWEKPAPLSRAEKEQVRLHGYHSERILAMSGALAPVAAVAGMHHERLDGSGYHRGSRGAEIPVLARFLAVADALTAMTRDRPYREAMSLGAAADELAQEARAGRLDARAVEAVLAVAGEPRVPGLGLRPAGLSDREVEVLVLVAAGRSNPEIATLLSISRRTAEHHVQHIYTKIGVSTRAGVALFALQHGLLAASPAGPP